MFACSTKKKSPKPGQESQLYVEAKQHFTAEELHILELIFDDLADRTEQKGIVKNTFLQLFPLTGLWGEKVWHEFDMYDMEVIDFQEFIIGLSKFCKAPDEEKIRHLFKLYDQDHDGYIDRDDLLSMLFSYSKDKIESLSEDIENRMLAFSQSTQLLATINAKDANHGVQTISTKKQILIHQSTNDLDQILPRQTQATQAQGNNEDVPEEECDGQHRDAVDRDVKDSGNVGSKKVVEDVPKKTVVVEDLTKRDQSQMLALAKRKHMMEDPPRPTFIHSNSSLSSAFNFQVKVNRLATSILNQYQHDVSQGKLSFEEFKEWIHGNPGVMKLLYQSFRQDVWGGEKMFSELAERYPEAGKRKLAYSKLEVHKKGQLWKKGKRFGFWSQRYFELRDQFLFYFDQPRDFLPKGVIFLKGLFIKKLNEPTGKKWGIDISTESPTYHHVFYADDAESVDEWTRLFKSFIIDSPETVFDIHEKLNSGKFSEVFRAMERTNQKGEVALKIIDKKKLTAEERELLISETAITKLLNHQNIIKLFETIETQERIYISLELMKDGDLYDYIRSKKYLEEYEACIVMRQLLDAFLYIQEMCVIHRDIKAENIMIMLNSNKTEIKYVKIIDFGFAQVLRPDDLLHECCGTPAYMAPEVLCDKGYNHYADNWSLGVLLYFMLRGHLPFESNVIENVVAKVLSYSLKFDDMHWANVSEEAKDLIKKLMARDPEDRIELEDALKHPWITKRDELKTFVGANKDNAFS